MLLYACRIPSTPNIKVVVTLYMETQIISKIFENNITILE
jgi:hypothetical protein